LIWLIPDERLYRFVGMVYQFLGVVGVLIGIAETRKQFGKAGLFAEAKSYLKSFPRLKPTIVAVMASILSDATLSATGTLTTTLIQNTSLEDRVSRLEHELEDLRQQNSRTEEEFNRFKDHVSQVISEERSTRASGIQSVRDDLIKVETGGLSLSLAGALWIILGIILTSIPMELAGLVIGMHK